MLEFFRVHMHDLKDVTNNVHYENFRYGHLATVTSEGQKTRPVTASKYVLYSCALSCRCRWQVIVLHYTVTVSPTVH